MSQIEAKRCPISGAKVWNFRKLAEMCLLRGRAGCGGGMLSRGRKCWCLGIREAGYQHVVTEQGTAIVWIPTPMVTEPGL